MKYLLLSLCVAIFTGIAFVYDKQNENPSDSPMVKQELDSFTFTKAEVNRAIQHAHEEYGTPKIPWKVHYTDSAREAVDVVKGESLFTRVALVRDTLMLYSTAFKITRDPDKTLYNVVLDELVNHYQPKKR